MCPATLFGGLPSLQGLRKIIAPCRDVAPSILFKSIRTTLLALASVKDTDLATDCDAPETRNA